MALMKFLPVTMAIVLCVGAATIRQDRTYKSAQYHWSVSYPAQWKVDASDPDFVQFTGPSRVGPGIVGIHSSAEVETDSVEVLADALLASEGGREISRRRGVLVDSTPMLEVMSVLGEGVQGKSWKVFVIDGKRAFVLDAETYLDSFPKLQPAFEKIVGSFRLK
jgi:hypothetical protein